MVDANLLKLFQWFSPSYPIGAFSYSHGLEYLVSQGEVADAQNLKSWLDDVLKYGAGRNDAILLVAAYQAENKSVLADIAELATAFNPGRERHLETTAQGAAFAGVTENVWGQDIASMPYPVVVGGAAKAHDLPLAETVSLYLQSFASNLISAGVRFIPLGQTEGQRILAELTEIISEITAEALGSDLDDLGGCTFRGDMASMAHETMSTRIFRT